MIHLEKGPVFLDAAGRRSAQVPGAESKARQNTMAASILRAHSEGAADGLLRLRFDALVSPDNNYVSILQSARAVGLEHFPVPYVLTNCHNSLCAVGGTVNEDDHVFGLDNARRCGGIFVPPYRAVLHQYMRERMAGCGKLILGSDSHTRYGALGTMGVGEGGGEILRQLMGERYEIAAPEVIAVVLTGAPRPGVGPCDAALELIGAVFDSGFVRNKVLEFIGPGVGNLDMDFRMGIDVMTTESAALSSIWCTDEKTREWLEKHGRGEEYRPLAPEGIACYDGAVFLDLSKVEPMMALPFHPSRALPIRVFKQDPARYLADVEREGNAIKRDPERPFHILDKLRGGELWVDQALISGCAGGIFGNLAAAADILRGHVIPAGGAGLGVHPASQPVMMELMRQGLAADLIAAGATLRPAMCGSCFGVMDVPADNQLSIRHVTRNYPNREGSKPRQGQMAAAILMDARSIAATMVNGGRLTGADELDVEYRSYDYRFDKRIYEGQVLDCFGRTEPDREVRMGPNIAPWPEMPNMKKHLLLKTVGVYEGSVTTDELVPSGEATAWRSNPEKLSAFTLVSRDADYVARSRALRAARDGEKDAETAAALKAAAEQLGCGEDEILIGGLVVSEKIGDGSSREQAASNQKVLAGLGNLAQEYSTKRYRSNCINWGLLPLRTEEKPDVRVGDWLLVEDVYERLDKAGEWFDLPVLGAETTVRVTLDALTDKEKQILKAGCLINYYRSLKQ